MSDAKRSMTGDSRRPVALLAAVLVSLMLVAYGGSVTAAAGGLAFIGCVGDLTGCTATTPAGALDDAEQIAVHGSNLYVTAATAQAVSHFTLDSAGNPGFAGCVGELSGCTATSPAAALENPSGAAVSGQNLYVVSANGALSHFKLDSAGSPSFAGCVGPVAGCTATSPSEALLNANDVAVRPGSLYVATLFGLSYFKLDSAGNPSFVGCISTHVSGCTSVSPVNALNGAGAMAFSAGNLYVADSYGSNVSHFKLATNGKPTFAGCIGKETGCTSGGALTVATGVAVKGQSLYASSGSNSIDGPGAVNQLSLSSAGTPSFHVCLGEKSGCTAVVPEAALDNAGSLALIGQDLYVASIYGVNYLALGSTGAPSFEGCIGELTGCTATTPAGALADAGGMASSGKNLYVTSVENNALSHLIATGPTVETKPATSVALSSAVLNGRVDPEGANTTCKFEYGTTTKYGLSASCAKSPGSGSSPVEVSAAVKGLKAGTPYHFRIAATNAAGTSKGEDAAFKTESA